MQLEVLPKAAPPVHENTVASERARWFQSRSASCPVIRHVPGQTRRAAQRFEKQLILRDFGECVMRERQGRVPKSECQILGHFAELAGLLGRPPGRQRVSEKAERGKSSAGLGSRRPPLVLGDAELLDLVLESCAFQSQPRGCTIRTGEHSPGLTQRFDNKVTLGAIRMNGGHTGHPSRWNLDVGQWDLKRSAGSKDDGSFD